MGSESGFNRIQGKLDTPEIAVEKVCKVFGPRPERADVLLEQGRTKDEILKETGLTVGVHNISFTVRKGEIFVVMGLSGSGKSTLVRMLNRLIVPTSGSIHIDGEEITTADREAVRQIRLRKIAMVFQQFALFPHMTVVENVEYGLKVRGMAPEERRERALSALDQVGLAAWTDRPPRSLSGGMQQRVGLARALATEADILLMDEPFSALDPLIRHDMQQELLALEASLNITIVFISHDLNEALTLGDRIAIMKDGRFVQVGTAQEIVASPADDYVRAFTKEVDRGRIFTAAAAMDDADPLDLATDTPQTALKRMEDTQRDGLLVMDAGRVVGVVTYQDLARAMRDNGADIASVMRRDYPTARPDDHLAAVYRRCSAGLPVAVTGRDGRLRGVLDPVRLFDKLSSDTRETPASGE